MLRELHVKRDLAQINILFSIEIREVPGLEALSFNSDATGVDLEILEPKITICISEGFLYLTT